MNAELLLTQSHNIITRRNVIKLYWDQFNKNKKQHIFTLQVVILWSLLSQEIVEAESISKYKKRIRQIQDHHLCMWCL